MHLSSISLCLFKKNENQSNGWGMKGATLFSLFFFWERERKKKRKETKKQKKR